MPSYSVNKKNLKIICLLLFTSIFIFLFQKSIQPKTSSISTSIHEEYIGSDLETAQTDLEAIEAKKMAFVTFLCDDVMGEATEVLIYSLKKTETKHDIVVLVLDEVSESVKSRLTFLGAKVINVAQVKYPWDSENARRKGFNKACRYSKLNLWNLTQYKKVVFLDADTMVVQSIDELFNYPQFTAAVDIGGVLNTGVFVAEPNEETYKDIMATYENAPSYNKGDQGFLNYYFNETAHPLPGNYNLMIKFTHFSQLALEFVTKNTVKVLHYTSETKPWNFHFLHQREWRENYDGYIFGFWTRAKREMLDLLEAGGLYKAPVWVNKKRTEYVCDRSISRGYGRKYSIVDQFSVLLQLRPSSTTQDLSRLIKFYLGSAKVNQIILNRSTVKDEFGKTVQLNNNYFKKLKIKKPVRVVAFKEFSSPNNRFNPIKFVQTNAVYIVEDTTVTSREDLEFAYTVWQKHMDSIVGFRADSHDDTRVIQGLDKLNQYSMMRSSSGMFLKADYLYGYTCVLPEVIHQYIDENPVCQDLGINMVASGLTGMAPILVHADVLYQKPSKFYAQKRTKCLAELLEYFNEQNPLVLNDQIISHSTRHPIETNVLPWNQWSEI